jgi:histidinol-phosphate aminotransferase
VARERSEEMTGPAPKPGVLSIPAYTPGKSTLAGDANPAKLSANENALGCSPLARAAFLDTAHDLSLYPDMRALKLREAVAKHYGLEPENLIFGAGSDEIFTLACQTYLCPGHNAVQPQYGFAAWAIAVQAAGGVMKNAPERNFHVDVDKVLEAVDRATRIVFVANPANPTGSAIPFGEILRLHENLRDDILLVIDGAYSEFAETGTYAQEFSLARSAPNVLVTKTFSKVFGLAALRIGWGYGASEIISAMERVRPPFNTTRAGQAAAIAALEDAPFLASSVRYVVEARAGLEGFIRSFGLSMIPSSANFITALFDGASKPAREVEAGLSRRGVLVRGLAGYGLPEALRITIGAPGDLERFRAAFEEIMG